MTALKPYLNYLKINMKTYFLVVITVMLLILGIGFVMSYIYLDSVQGGAATKAGGMSFSSMYGSMSGVAMVQFRVEQLQKLVECHLALCMAVCLV